MFPYILLGIVLLILIILIANIRIVPQASAYVIQRLGAYRTTWSTGFHWKVPFIDAVAMKVNLKEQVADFPPQPVITKDNATIQIDTVIFFQITDPKAYTYGVERPMMATKIIIPSEIQGLAGMATSLGELLKKDE